MSNEITNRTDASCCEVGTAGGSSAGLLGGRSAAFASACCGLPLLPVAFGLGGLGLGSFLGTYHWYFTGAGAVFLAAGWYVFLN